MNEPRKRVLVVDDELGVRESVRILLSEGYEVATVASGDLALEAIQRERPHLVLLDIIMPGMDGVEFLERIRRIERYRETPVVVITAKSLSDAERRALERQAISVLQKGDELGAELARVLRGALRRIRAPAAS